MLLLLISSKKLKTILALMAVFILQGCEEEIEQMEEVEKEIVSLTDWLFYLPLPLQFFGWGLLFILFAFTLQYEYRKRKKR